MLAIKNALLGAKSEVFVMFRGDHETSPPFPVCFSGAFKTRFYMSSNKMVPYHIIMSI